MKKFSKFNSNFKLQTSNSYSGGQTLILLLVMIMMIIAITTAATLIIATNSSAASNSTIGLTTKQMAESGAERAMLELLRDPMGYDGGDTPFNLDDGTVTVVIDRLVRSPDITVISTAVNGSYTKRIELIVTYSSNVLTLVSWKDLN